MLTATCTENAREEKDEELFVFLTSQGFAKRKKSPEFKSSWRRSLVGRAQLSRQNLSKRHLFWLFWVTAFCWLRSFCRREHNEQNAMLYFPKKKKKGHKKHDHCLLLVFLIREQSVKNAPLFCHCMSCSTLTAVCVSVVGRVTYRWRVLHFPSVFSLISCYSCFLQ